MMRLKPALCALLLIAGAALGATLAFRFGDLGLLIMGGLSIAVALGLALYVKITGLELPW